MELRRVANARRIAAVAAVGGAGVGLGAAGIGVLIAEAALARRAIGPRRAAAPYADGRYGSGTGMSLRLVVLGDSSAAGLGADSPAQTTGAILAAGLAQASGRPVRYQCLAEIGAESRGLASQVDRAVIISPHVAVVLIGGNDVTHRIKPPESVRLLAEAVTRLRALGAEVIVGTCPDLGTVGPIRPPLRWVARRLSRQLAAAQAIGAVEAGARAISLGDLLGPEFAARPHDMFAADRFHPSSAGYAAVAEALLPSVLAATGFPNSADTTQPSDLSLAQAAVAAADLAGTEISADVVAARAGPTGIRWASVRRRVRVPLPNVAPPEPLDDITLPGEVPPVAR